MFEALVRGTFCKRCANSNGSTRPVGQKLSNCWGLFDMYGNVKEWCHDWKTLHVRGPRTDPMGAVSGEYRVVRGGCWYYSAETCGSSIRQGYIPSFRGYTQDQGFRMVTIPANAKSQRPTGDGR